MNYIKIYIYILIYVIPLMGKFMALIIYIIKEEV